MPNKPATITYLCQQQLSRWPSGPHAAMGRAVAIRTSATGLRTWVRGHIILVVRSVETTRGIIMRRVVRWLTFAIHQGTHQGGIADAATPQELMVGLSPKSEQAVPTHGHKAGGTEVPPLQGLPVAFRDVFP
jgi:hypothetical protein